MKWWYLYLVLVTLPALWCFTQADTITQNDVPTPDKILRDNERVGSKTDHEVVEREGEAINPDGFNQKELQILDSYKKVHKFEAEVDKLMNIIINSLYSNREVFLRELISNASDALDKIRFLSLKDKTQLDTKAELEIRIRADPATRTLQITDSGLGMTRQDLERNLGTIAKSGTTEFIQSAGKESTSDLIGQFGVGFYSVFLVADDVTVISKNNNDTQHVWQSDAHGAFTVAEDPRGNTLGRGTTINIHLKEGAEEYLEDSVLKALVIKYSEFINFPILLWTSSEEEKEVLMTPEEIAAEKGDEDEEIKLDEDTDTEAVPKTKKVTEKVQKWEVMNQQKPIWTRNPKDITDEDYNNFYKSFTKETTDPLFHIHFNGEGDVEFKSLLYIPSEAPANLFDPKYEKDVKGVKLYVRRVFITDQFKELLPKYLNFLRGIVDSDDLPLNVSREMLQEHKLLQVIKKKLIRKAIAMFQMMAEEEDNDKYRKFWSNFGTNIKLGVVEDTSNRVRLSKLLMFQSSKTGNLTTLDKYVDRMKEGQEQIYYLAGESKEVVQRSPLVERLLNRDYEVLYMVDPIDEYCIGNLEKYDGKFKLTNIAREGLKLDGEETDADQEKADSEEFAPLLSYLKKALPTKIEKAVVSTRLAKSPSALVAGQYGYTANMERIMRAQAIGGDNLRNPMFAPKKIMEVNVNHPLIQELKNRIVEDESDATAADIASLMYDTAALASGFTLDDPAVFSSRIIRMMNLGLGLEADAQATERPVFKKESSEGKDEL